MSHTQSVHNTPATNTDFEDLAQLIEALPRRFRPCLLSAAIQLEPSCSIKVGEFVGMYRTRLFDCLVERTGPISVALWRAAIALDQPRIQQAVKLFAEAPDLPAVRAILADLLQIITDAIDVVRR